MEDKKRINIALNVELHKKVKLATVEQDITITDFVVKAIEEKLEKIKAEKTAQIEYLSNLLESGNEKKIIEKAARERLGYVYADEQIFIDVSGN